jgi:hypothetical protein
MPAQLDEATVVIPPSAQVRSRLAKCLREAHILRRLLKISVQAERDEVIAPVGSVGAARKAVPA